MKHIIGITGGTGCGKTTVLTVLQSLGFHIIDCDALYHRLLQENASMLRAINEAFPGVVEDGILQRKKLGQVVFSSEAALDTLNKTVWPFVKEAVRQEIQAHDCACAIDAIGLFESGLAELCTFTVAVTAPKEVRISRLMARDGISEEYAALRINAQRDDRYFAEKCTLTLHNNFPTEAEFCQFAVEQLKEKLL